MYVINDRKIFGSSSEIFGTFSEMIENVHMTFERSTYLLTYLLTHARTHARTYVFVGNLVGPEDTANFPEASVVKRIDLPRVIVNHPPAFGAI